MARPAKFCEKCKQLHKEEEVFCSQAAKRLEEHKLNAWYASKISEPRSYRKLKDITIKAGVDNCSTPIFIDEG